MWKLRQVLSFSLIVFTVAVYVVLDWGELRQLKSQPVAAQPAEMQTVAEQVYQQLPDLPQENQYISKQTKTIAADSTLVKRLITYHTLVKGRSPVYRLDWKITLADYLGLNDWLNAKTYPGHGFLKSNPMEGDRKAIQQLNRQQREALIQALVSLHSDSQQTTAPVPATTTSKTTEVQTVEPQLQPLPQSDGAKLLKPAAIPQPSPQPQSDQPTGKARLLLPLDANQ